MMDWQSMDHSRFYFLVIEAIWRDPSKPELGVNGCIPKGAFDRAMALLDSMGISRPTIVQVIEDPEVEVTYVVE